MSKSTSHWPPTPSSLRTAFDDAPPYTVGLEDEVMLLAPETLELVPRAPEVLALLDEDRRFKLELPASQLEIVTPIAAGVEDSASALLEARRMLAERAEGHVRLASAGVHPFSPGSGELNRLPRYESTIAQYGPIARLQLVCALQIHVAVGDADRALAVYNAARSYLPLLAALAANAPFYEGRDTGLASVRPAIGRLLPRQGIPPPIAGWDAYAETFRWGAATRTFETAQTWWWELRLHPSFGTLEFRVPDGQSTVADATAIAALTQALVAWLGERHDAGEQLEVAETWQIEENRWLACRDGVEGEMAQLGASARRRPTRELLRELIERLAPAATRLGSERALTHAARMVEANGSIAQRQAAEFGGAGAVARWLSERFLEEPAWG
ncbi:MAG: YbdK family carboxylate-amine ligase [Solirubrobacterales bacterium]|nr:YbdK family carboxylate-amine ligase [Solirubrobacterales bacterium]